MSDKEFSEEFIKRLTGDDDELQAVIEAGKKEEIKKEATNKEGDKE